MEHGVQKLLSGSVAEEISRLAACPVLLIGPEVASEPEAEVPPDRILHATDFSPESKHAMNYAYALARAYGAHLYFLHVAEDVLNEPLSTRMPADAFIRLRLLEKGWPPREEGIEPEFLVEFGSPEVRTLEVADQRVAQLIVLNVHGTTHPDLSAHRGECLQTNP